MATHPSLSALLSQVLISLSLAFERAGSGKHPLPGLEVWSNLLRCVDDDGLVEGDLPEATRLSKRAVRSRVGNAIRQGWLRVESGKPGTRNAHLRPTVQGQEVRQSWPGLTSDALAVWTDQAGTDAAALKASLRALVGKLELELPHFPASYGGVDWSVTGNGGQDWRPVRRAAGDTTKDLELPALLSQALMAFTLEYEADAGIASCLALDANVIRFLGAEGRPVTVLPRQRRDGLDTIERHGFVERYDEGGTTYVRLTVRGQEAHDTYAARLAAVEKAWDERYDVAALRKALEAIVHTLQLDLPHHPIGLFDPRTGVVV
ncbi:hypothetical protein [Tenggerimyces flavus]|uniref:Uncharacterized protein n=1 Tax=Tenggerimyces flavus TaxID=1708749 RepID=A0ABV7YAC3_9ACTN|nr:hypothetical protein [Tenggerimyces flavus]MBM7788939.1 hypothetical protein [Tenggerimyces flavus]